MKSLLQLKYEQLITNKFCKINDPEYQPKKQEEKPQNTQHDWEY